MRRRVLSPPAQWAAIGLGLVAYGLYTGFLAPRQITNDEAWFLQVTQRMLSGDVLYRDIFLGVTPLSAYLTAALAAVFGVELVVVKGVLAVAFAANTLLACRIGRQLGLSDGSLGIVILAQIAYVPSWVPGAGSPYTPLAYVLFLASFSCFLSWRKAAVASAGERNQRAPWALAAAGFLGGLAFATRQTMGLYLLAGLGLAVLANYRQLRMNPPCLIRHWAVVSVAWCAPAVGVLLPVWLSGGGSKLLDYAFLNKATYLQAAQFGYDQALAFLWRQTLSSHSISQFMDVYMQLQVLLPIPAFAGLAAVLWRAASRSLPVTVLVLTSVGFADVYPRFGLGHTSCTVAFLLIAILWAWGQSGLSLPRRIHGAVVAGMALWLAAGALFLVTYPVVNRVLGGYVTSDLPHLQGTALPAPALAALRAESKALRANVVGESLFIVNPSASKYYLITGLRNPTPFDYPLVTAFGLTGEADVAAALLDGRIPQVCLTPLGTYYLRPAYLESFIPASLEAVGPAGPCTLYRSRR